jgi:hypothetical protein
MTGEGDSPPTGTAVPPGARTQPGDLYVSIRVAPDHRFSTPPGISTLIVLRSRTTPFPLQGLHSDPRGTDIVPNDPNVVSATAQVPAFILCKEASKSPPLVTPVETFAGSALGQRRDDYFLRCALRSVHERDVCLHLNVFTDQNPCKGDGLKSGAKRSQCRQCNGTGTRVHLMQGGFHLIVLRSRTTPFPLQGLHSDPRGTDIPAPPQASQVDGMRLRVTGEGDSPPTGTAVPPGARTQPGDLYVSSDHAISVAGAAL